MLNETVDLQTIINLAAGLVGFLAAWVLRVLWSEVADLRRSNRETEAKCNELQVMIAGDYVRRVDLEKMIEALFRKLDKIEDRLASKVDK